MGKQRIVDAERKRTKDVAVSSVVGELKKKKKKDKKKKKARLEVLEETVANPAAALEFLKRHEIVIHAEDAPLPVTVLASAPFPLPLLELLVSQPGFHEPSAIQGATWPLAVSGRDVSNMSLELVCECVPA